MRGRVVEGVLTGRVGGWIGGSGCTDRVDWWAGVGVLTEWMGGLEWAY